MKLLAACGGTLAVFVAVAAAWLCIWRRGLLLAKRWPWLAALGKLLWKRRSDYKSGGAKWERL